MERRTLLKAAPAALLMAGATGVAGPLAPAVGAAAAPSVGADAQDILNALYRWSLGYDSRDIALMMSGFTDDPTFIFRNFDGSVAVFEGFDAVLGLFQGALAGQTDQRRHVTTNSLMERIDRRTVKVTSYLVLCSILPTDPTSELLLTTGVYRDTVVRQGGVWRIAERDLTLDGSSARPA
jgi:hypothetical protein